MVLLLMVLPLIPLQLLLQVTLLGSTTSSTLRFEIKSPANAGLFCAVHRKLYVFSAQIHKCLYEIFIFGIPFVTNTL